ncbi:MAG TPA: CAP domain-containing protein [Gaiellaceae bacterium]|nr:CAP domain-containing protein [Gaiellaceae bacterium]
MLWKKKVLLALLATVFLLLAAPAALASGARLTATESGLLRSVNATRVAHGLHPLTIDPTLVRAARSHSLDMVRRDYFAHGSFVSRMLSFGARGPVIGENLAWGNGSYSAPTTVIREWLLSPEHRRNLLRPGYRRIGIGAVAGAFLGQGGATVFTADFAGR